MVQSNGVILGALSTGGAMAPDFRELFTQLMFTLRRSPALSLVAELHPNDVTKFRAETEELNRRIAFAVAPERTQQSWADVLEFEMTRERQVMDLQGSLMTERLALQSRKRELEASKDSATMTGFVVQQLGFVVILLAGLVHEHGGGLLRRQGAPTGT